MITCDERGTSGLSFFKPHLFQEDNHERYSSSPGRTQVRSVSGLYQHLFAGTCALRRHFVTSRTHATDTGVGASCSREPSTIQRRKEHGVMNSQTTTRRDEARKREPDSEQRREEDLTGRAYQRLHQLRSEQTHVDKCVGGSM